MEPWIQPTTAPKQPDLDTDDQAVDEGEPRVERGWMEAPQPASETWVGRWRDSLGITVLAVAVAVGFCLVMVVLLPLLLLITAPTI